MQKRKCCKSSFGLCPSELFLSDKGCLRRMPLSTLCFGFYQNNQNGGLENEKDQFTGLLPVLYI
jgi:hypothetical protein